ncbi:DUF480 domain-containing protein [Maribrevibacterium harenarium]|uniref:DUF480 domain-containing protein n=1 Tax=Maribrevibacterium harenarium TaxID=2589817 RepID=A0A501WJS6_9GAMM|nr:DUF480 domain-containing protein [Maribrevibacterium harenarium]TPE47397.1 DUF480 domain-containing protein [Maribrevibacterium harenarium]
MSYYTLSAQEMRVIGCLIEKSLTTPDLYPLSLNSLTNACNQKSSREPVVNYTETEVQQTLDDLESRALITELLTPGSRVAKYQHRFCNTEFSDLQFTPAQTAILCMLFLRGPQTPGELRSRSGRLHAFANIQEVEEALNALANMTGGPFVQQLPREPGKRESRYTQLFCTDETLPSPVSDAELTLSEEQTTDLHQRVTELEAKVAELLDRITDLENRTDL